MEPVSAALDRQLVDARREQAAGTAEEVASAATTADEPEEPLTIVVQDQITVASLAPASAATPPAPASVAAPLASVSAAAALVPSVPAEQAAPTASSRMASAAVAAAPPVLAVASSAPEVRSPTGLSDIAAMRAALAGLGGPAPEPAPQPVSEQPAEPTAAELRELRMRRFG